MGKTLHFSKSWNSFPLLLKKTYLPMLSQNSLPRPGLYISSPYHR